MPKAGTMKMTPRPALAPFLLIWLVGSLACGLERSLPPQQSGAQFLAAAEQTISDLERACGSVRLRPHPQLGTAAALEFAVPLRLNAGRSASLSTALRDFVLRYRALFGLSAVDTLAVEDSTADSLGMRRVVFSQRRFGVTVWSSRLSAHLASDGKDGAASSRLVRLVGHLLPLPTLATASSQPTLSAEAGRQEALAAGRARVAAPELSAQRPSLYYLATAQALHLVYRVEVFGQSGSYPVRWAYFIDAHDGSVRAIEDLVVAVDVTVPAQGRGRGALGTDYSLPISQRGASYLLQDPTRGGQRTTRLAPFEKLPGKTVTSPVLDRWDEDAPAPGLAVDIHAHLATLWDYFATRHGRFGWDGNGHGLVAAAHLGEAANLALFDGERLLFGDGDGRDYGPLGAAFDIVSHEYVHAVTRASADLAASGESGVLDEGFADLLACLIEKSVRPAAESWLLGEEVYHPAGRPAALVDVRDPAGHAGLPGYVGFLLAQQLGDERTAAIVYRALTTYLFRYADFADAEAAMAAAARDLYGDAAAAAVTASWAQARRGKSAAP